MRVAFWNVNMGTGSHQNRKSTFTNWVNTMQPELLLLEELSHTLATGAAPNNIEALSGYTQIGFVNTRDRDGNQSTKCLSALAPPATAANFDARALRFPKFRAPDMRQELSRL